MQKGIRQMQRGGWEVAHTEVVQGRHGCKSVVYGCLFLPLALLGRKRDQYKVEYRREL